MVAQSETRNERERKHDRAIDMRGKGQVVTNDSDSNGIDQVQTASLKKRGDQTLTLQNSSCNIIPVKYESRGE
jgi:hypothetical protein